MSPTKTVCLWDGRKDHLWFYKQPIVESLEFGNSKKCVYF